MTDLVLTKDDYGGNGFAATEQVNTYRRMLC